MDRPPHDQQENAKSERDLFFVVKISSALGLGTLAGFLQSLKEVHPNLRIELGTGTVLTFLVTGAVAWFFCGLMMRADAESDTPAGRTQARRRFFKRWLMLFGGLCAAGTVLAFVRSLKNVGASSRRDVLFGTGLAVLVLGAGAWLIYKAVRFFEDQDRAALEELDEPDEEHPED